MLDRGLKAAVTIWKVEKAMAIRNTMRPRGPAPQPKPGGRPGLGIGGPDARDYFSTAASR